jgi:MFS family permease
MSQTATTPGNVRTETELVVRSRSDAPADVHAKVSRTLWVSTAEGSITQVFFNWTAGSVLTGYMLYYGASSFALGAVASVPMLAQAVGPIVAWLGGRVASRKDLITVTAALGRGLWLLAPLLPWLPIAPHHIPMLLVWITAVSCLIQVGAGPPWVALMADVVPEDIRGRYFGLRSAIVNLFGMVMLLGSGWYLDRARAPGGFQMVLFLAVVFAMVGVFLYRFYYEPKVPRVMLSLRDAFQAPFRDANFRRFLLFSAYWQAAVMIAAPFVIPYFLKHLQMSFTQIAVWNAIACMAALVLSPLWGRVADAMGHKTVLVYTTVIAGTLHPVCWLLATPGHMGFIYVSGFMDALSWGGINPALFNLGIATTPARHRLAYIAVLGMVNGLVGCAVGLLSGPLLNLLARVEFTVHGYAWTGYHSLIVLSMCFRTQAWRLLGGVTESRARPARELLGAMVAWGLSPFSRSRETEER